MSLIDRIISNVTLFEAPDGVDLSFNASEELETIAVAGAALLARRE